MKLTPEQIDIIQHEDGHAKVIAVAGAGKTTTMGLFIRQRLSQGANSKRMLVIMYNKSAQLDFSQKLAALTHSQTAPNDEYIELPQVRTFHSLGLKIYQGLIKDRVLAEFNGELISQAEQEQILWRLMQKHANKDIALDILNDKKKWLDPMLSFIEQVKSSLEPAALVFKQQGLPKNCQFFIAVFDAFETWRQQSKRITFSDMLYDPCMLFSRRPDLAQKYSNHMDWVLVDEYQDINPIQQFLLEVVCGERANVMVIGDPDQTIYEFRGSSSQFMLSHFDARFKSARHYTLSTTFRYGHDVALLSNQLIMQNKNREQVMAIANEGNPDTQVFSHFQDDYAEQSLVIIKDALKTNNAEDVAILVRLWGMSAPIELALLHENIPYQIESAKWVLERYELQTFMMLLAVNSGVFFDKSRRSQYQSWLLFFTFPALKIKRSELEKLARLLSEAGENAFDKFNALSLVDLSVWQKQQLENRINLIKPSKNKTLRVNQLFNRYIRETDFYKGIADGAFSRQQVDDRIATVQGFVRFMSKLNILASDGYEYLQNLKALKLNQRKKKGVIISSIHRAKGLEWPVIILPALTEHYYPYQEKSEMQKPSSVEEERRLFYVAMTRSQQQLHLIAPSLEGSQNEVSPFIKNMEVVDLLKLKPAVINKATEIQLPKTVMNSANAYAEKLNWSISIKQKVYQKPVTHTFKKSNTQGLKTVSAAELESVNHRVFGNGVVQLETDSHWHVQFNDGQLRVLDKKISDPHLTWL